MHCSEPRLYSPLLEAPGEYKVESATQEFAILFETDR
jgi:hypothetical protein